MSGCSSSDLDEELPVFDFLQPSQRCSQISPTESDKAARTKQGAADVMTISSDSDDDYAPLAQRLKSNSDPSAVSNGKIPDCGSFFSRSSQNGIIVTEHAPGVRQEEPQSLETSPARRKLTKRTREEIQTSREEALRRRQEKEEQEKQKAEKRAVAEAAKALRPDECIKHMVVAVDPALLQLEGGGALLASLQALGCSCAIEKQPLPRSVSWARRAPPTQSSSGASVPESQVVMQMTVEDFITLTHNFIQEQKAGRSDSAPSLTTWVQQQQRRQPSKTLSLAVIELEKYFRSQKAVNQKKFKEAVRGEATAGGGRGAKERRKKGGAEALPEVSRVQVEEAVVQLQLHSGISVHFLPSWKEFADYIAMTTKAVAEAPFKREREKTGFSFYLESEWAGGHRVDRGGRGLLQVWKRQIQQFNRVSPDMAAAILAAYPSPQLLLQAYAQCHTESERMSLLSDLLIRRGEGVTSTTRRVGPELSKRIFLAMHSPDPEQTLDSSL
ncbi:crossover junction endonuclease EME1 isoform X2 [Oryzias melastigma]|uniref:Essential meiotic structure-specific endonuclease 1 n=1 Tax=Oryzias melastigma TaxID=30732 RepID=A0A3B3DTQ9_ORYME|nr:crossover junction endonuclease EME1 isoform X2 [Oryzias melastigma]